MRNRLLVATVLTTIVMVPLACGSSGRSSASTPTTASRPSDPGGPGEPTGPDATDPGTAITVDAGALPQTREVPTSDSAAFTAGVQALWNGIVADDPSQAMPFFFPLSAYRQVKAVHDPPADWQNRLVAAYTRDIHALHRQLGADPAAATLIALDVPDHGAVWVDPGQEVNKIGYWRVYGSTLRYRVGATEHTMAIYSLISWRGQWYIVHVTHP